MNYKSISEADKEKFEEDGYLILRGYFHREEIDRIYGTAQQDEVMKKKAIDRGDAEGLRTKLSLWYNLDDSIYSLMARSNRLVDGSETILGTEVAHFHTKLMQKEPKKGGAWEWHQDYGYWYKDGFLFPDMISVMTALSPANKKNGCLQVIRGSHKLDRINHGFSGEQVGADMERVNEALKQLELVYVELEPGDSLFFHCNLLHRSDANLSDNPRWSIISVYNRITNKPFKGKNTSSYTPIDRVPDEEIMETELHGISEGLEFNEKVTKEVVSDRWSVIGNR